ETECEEIRRTPDASGHEVMAAGDAAKLEGLLECNAVITGWARQDRMMELLEPPIAPETTLLFYSLEDRWYRGQRGRRERRRSRGLSRSDRRKIFPGIRGWSERIPSSDGRPDALTESALEELEAIDDHGRQTRRRHVIEHARDEGVGEPV